MRSAFMAVCVLTIGMGSAAAQEVYLDDEEPMVEVPAEAYADAEPADEVDIVDPGPRVYGWHGLRPENCGTFKYWNGEYCADARDEPPREDVD